MVNLVYYPTNLLFFDIPLLYHYISLCSIYSFPFITLPELFFDKILKTFVALSVILLPVRSPVFFIRFIYLFIYLFIFEAVLSALVEDC